MSTPKKKKPVEVIRTYATDITDHSGIMAVVCGTKDTITSTVVVWYRKTLAAYDGDDFRYGEPAPLKVMLVEDFPKIYFDCLCELAKLDDQDAFRSYLINTLHEDPSLKPIIDAQLNARKYEMGNISSYVSQLVTMLRTEVEDYIECSGTPWRRFRTWMKRIMHPEDFIPKTREKKEKVKK